MNWTWEDIENWFRGRDDEMGVDKTPTSPSVFEEAAAWFERRDFGIALAAAAGLPKYARTFEALAYGNKRERQRALFVILTALDAAAERE